MADIELTTAPTETAVDPADLEYFVDVSETPDAINQITTQNRHNSFAASTTEALTGTAVTKHITPDALASLWEQGSDIASAGTISVGEGGYFFVTGTTTITDVDFATDKAGRKVWLKFNGILTLTHHATTLILPTGANIVTAAGDIACFISEGSDNVRCVSYTRASGAALVGGGGMAIGDPVTSGTAGSIPFIDGSGNLAQDNANFFFDNTNDRLEIFGSDSAGQVHIGGAGAGYGGVWFGQASPTSSNFSFLGTTTTTYFNASNTLEFRIANTALGTVNTSYNWVFGVGTAADSSTGMTVTASANPAYNPLALKLAASQSADALRVISSAAALLLSITATGGIDLLEQSAHAAPAANRGVIYTEDNGSGKTRLMVRFASGAAQQIAIEP